MQSNSPNKTESSADEFFVPDLGHEDLDDLDMSEVIPTMDVPASPLPVEEESLVRDSTLLGLWNEIIENCRKDRGEAEEIEMSLRDMVCNGDQGEGTPDSTKTMLVNVMKLKTDINDKMTRVAELMTRVKLRDKDTFKPFMAIQGRPSGGMQNKKAILAAFHEKRRKEESGE